MIRLAARGSRACGSRLTTRVLRVRMRRAPHSAARALRHARALLVHTMFACVVHYVMLRAPRRAHASCVVCCVVLRAPYVRCVVRRALRRVLRRASCSAYIRASCAASCVAALRRAPCVRALRRARASCAPCCCRASCACVVALRACVRRNLWELGGTCGDLWKLVGNFDLCNNCVGIQGIQ